MGDQRVALVTGCGKRDGMGRAIANRLAAAGLAVVITDLAPTGVRNLRQEKLGDGDDGSWRGLDSVVDEICAAGGTASSVTGDVGVEADARRMVDEMVARHGRLDVLVNNAAAPQGLDRGDIEQVPVEVFDRVLQVNARGTYLMSRFSVPHMRRGRWGRIVSISSMAGMIGAPSSTAYSASKAAIIGFTRALSMDVAGWGITVNAICPGMVATSRALLSLDPELDAAAEIERRGRNVPVGRPGRPDDIAAAVAYLASEDAGFVTGTTLVLDGGGFTRFPVSQPPDR
ncbi:MAG TPA: SDR family oxidoreductase [Candidatus Dormibacteraeota bacterium]|nr:SDR family oxidoreductase [Candidatus Dormibacteraeota bacterium]